MTAPSATKNWLEETRTWPRDPLQYYVEFPFHGAYYPLGLPLEISTNHRAVLTAAQQTWGPFPPMQSAAKIHLRFGVSDSGCPDLPRPPSFRAQRGLITIVSDSENFGVCDVTAGFGFSWVTPATVGDSAFFRYHFLDVMAGLLLAPIHFAIVHAACVAYDGHGFLLCGHSGAGKSTLAFACAQRGWTFISDDAGYAPRMNAGRTVIGNPLYLRLRKDASNLFPELREQAVVLRQNGELGFEIPTDNLPGIATAFQCKVDHIVFLKRDTIGSAKLAAFPKEEAQRRLEHVLEYTLACKPACNGIGHHTDMALANPDAREEQKASIRRLLSADVHELCYSNLGEAIDCLESIVRHEHSDR
jgi:hypothetical protein